MYVSLCTNYYTYNVHVTKCIIYMYICSCMIILLNVHVTKCIIYMYICSCMIILLVHMSNALTMHTGFAIKFWYSAQHFASTFSASFTIIQIGKNFLFS